MRYESPGFQTYAAPPSAPAKRPLYKEQPQNTPDSQPEEFSDSEPAGSSAAFPRPAILGAPQILPDVSPIFGEEASPDYCTVRFLNCASGYALGIRIGSLMISTGVSFGEVTFYSLIPDGFRTVRLTDENDPSILYLQESVPFRAGDLITLAIVRTAAGLDLVQVSDTPCKNRPGDMACIRMANMAFGAPGLDLILDENKLVFSDISFKEVTMFKQARPKRYRFSIAATINIPTPYESDVETIEEMPRLLPAYIMGLRPAISFTLNAKAELVYSIYVIGNWTRPRLKILVNEGAPARSNG